MHQSVVQCEDMFLLDDNSWEVRETLYKGKGIFAKEKIESGTVIGDYLGTVIEMSEYDIQNDSRGLYLMYLTDETCIYPDLTKPGLHLINHSCKPNCWIYTYRLHTLFFSLRTIQPGEELSISYLLSPLDHTCAPCVHDCHCGDIMCTGTMHLSRMQFTLWQKFQHTHVQQTRKKQFTNNMQLPQLYKYPHRIPIDPVYDRIVSARVR